MKKKVLSAIVCAAMVFSMTACGLQSPNTGGNSGGTTNAASTSNASATSDAAEAETTTEAASSERGVLNPNHQKSRAHRLKMAALRYCQSYLYSLLAYRPQCCNK